MNILKCSFEMCIKAKAKRLRSSVTATHIHLYIKNVLSRNRSNYIGITTLLFWIDIDVFF